MSAPETILVRGVNWLGDAVMSLPALQRLREARPDARITLLTPAKLADLWEHHPAVDEVIPVPPEETVWETGRRIRRGGFQTALVFPNSPRSALETWLGRVPRRAGYARPWRNLFLTDNIPPRPGERPMRKRTPAEVRELIRRAGPGAPPPPAAHHIHQYLHLTAAVFGANPAPVAPQLFIRPEETDAAKKLLGIPEDGRPLFGMNPGAAYGPAKQWPEAYFVSAAGQLHRQTGCRWVIFGGPSERALAERLADALRGREKLPERSVVAAAGRTTLRELCATLAACRVLLGNDSGPMHLAAAAGTPVVALFGSTSAPMTCPGLPGDSRHACLTAGAPCSPCFLRECPADFRCMKDISPERAVAAVLSVCKPHTSPA